MKNNRGKLILWLLFWSFLTLNAEDFDAHLETTTLSPYLKEGVVFTLELTQTNPDVVLLFHFTPQKSDDYAFERLGIEENEAKNHLHILYTYLLYPLKTGEINITFELIKKITTQERIDYSISGDRDNIKKLVTLDTPISLAPLRLSVKPLPTGTRVVGDFTLSSLVPKHRAKAYEPLPLQVQIKGKGYPPILETLLPKEGNFTRFIEKPLIQSDATREGTQSTITYPMALSHSHSFTLESLIIHAFNPQTQKSYTLTLPSQHFEIETPTPKSLLDTTNSPPKLKETIEWSSWGQWILSLLLFGAGYLTALTLKWRKKKQTQTAHPLVEKIRHTQDAKALLQLLMATHHQDFSPMIEKLESSLYGKGKISLEKVKKEAIERL